MMLVDDSIPAELDKLKETLFANAKKYNDTAVKLASNPQKGHEMSVSCWIAIGIENILLECGLYDEYLQYCDKHIGEGDDES